MDSGWRYSFRQADLDPMDCGSHIQAAARELQAIFGRDRVRVVNWNESYAGMAITISVDIPTRGPVGGVDIREQEPVLLLFHKTKYPHTAPQVRSDRPDFPVERLAHLNPAFLGQPAFLCLHRGSINDWFAEHSLVSLIERAQGWLRDAASNRLIREADRFEATRTEIERRVGLAVYDPAALECFIRDKWAAGEGRGMAALLCWTLGSADQDSLIKGTSLAIRVDNPLALEDLRKFRTAGGSLNRLSDEMRGETDRALIGLLMWPDQNRICNEYFGRLPDSLATLAEFSDQLGLPLGDALDRYLKDGLQLPGRVPLILAIQRPRPLIGSESSIELLNLVLCAGEDHWPEEDKWKPDTPVFILGNRAPVTVSLARKLSASPPESRNGRVLLLGCGALGSKIGLHLARAGLTELTLIDYDGLSPHNLIRHGLLADSVGENKAVGLEKTIKAIFPNDLANVRVKALQSDALEVLFGNHRQLLGEHAWILDCTASASVLNALTDPRVAQSPPLMRCEIADQGRLGFLTIEGTGRNPRLDDLQMVIYDRAISDDRIAAWLHRQQDGAENAVGRTLEEITIGLGCSSRTMRMADDVISYHAAVAATTIRDRLAKEMQPGGIQLSFWGGDATPRGSVEFVEVAKSRVLVPSRASGWQVRLGDKLNVQLQDRMRAAHPNETGGLLLGFIHHKRKTIYITRALTPPPDSEGWPYAFRLGVMDVPDQLIRIQIKTGGLIGYVGEWHSHPNGPSRLSSTDKAAMRQISAHLKAAGLPTHIMVVTPKGCFPHLFHHR